MCLLIKNYLNSIQMGSAFTSFKNRDKIKRYLRNCVPTPSPSPDSPVPAPPCVTAFIHFVLYAPGNSSCNWTILLAPSLPCPSKDSTLCILSCTLVFFTSYFLEIDPCQYLGYFLGLFFFFLLLQLHIIMLYRYTVTCLTDSLLVHTWIDSSLLLLQALL